MTVTDIIPGRKKLSSIYIDGEFAVKLDAQLVEEHCLNVGNELDDDELHDLIYDSNYKRAKEKALYLISGHDYSQKNLYDKLRRDYPEDVAERVIERMEELGLLNDEAYARRMAHDLLYLKKMSARGAVYKMMEKGIDKSLAEEIVEEFELDPVEMLVELIERKYADKLDDEKSLRRTVASLQRLGYSWGEIRAALDEFQ